MQNDKDELFNQVKELLQQETTQIAFDTWLKPVELVEMTGDHVVLKANSDYHRELVKTRYGDLILNTFKYLTNKEWTFSVIWEDKKNSVGGSSIISNSQNENQDQEIEISNKTLNPKYTFDTFVVGNNNRFAHAAAIAVGEKPGES